MFVDVKQLAVAFEAWETSFRMEPSKFSTAEETAAMGVSEVSLDRAEYMLDLLQQTSEEFEHVKAKYAGNVVTFKDEGKTIVVEGVGQFSGSTFESACATALAA